MVIIDESIATDHRRIIVEVTQVLLDAGAKVNTPKEFIDTNSEPLNFLLRGMIHIYEQIRIEYDDITSYEQVCAIRNNVRLVVDLVKLLLTHGADPRRERYEFKIMAAAEATSKHRRNTPDCTNLSLVYDEIMDYLGCIFRCIVLAGGDGLTIENCISIGYITNPWQQVEFQDLCFGYMFISIAEASFPSGHSQTLINMILSALSTSNVAALGHYLTTQRARLFQQSTTLRVKLIREYTADSYNDIKEVDKAIKEIDQAMKYVNCVETPRRLEFLACREIRRAMPKKTLLSESSVGLGLPIPSQLEPLILLQFDTNEGRGELNSSVHVALPVTSRSTVSTIMTS